MTTEQTPGAPAETNRWRRALTEITTGNALLSLLAILLAVLIGGILIAITDPDVQEAAGYFFSRPADTFGAIWQSISGAYVAARCRPEAIARQ